MAEESLKKQTVKGLAWKTTSTIFNTGFGFIVGIVLARLLCPSDYGLTAMVGVFTSVLTLFTDGGLSTALIRKQDRTEADMATVFYYNIAACWTIYAILFFSAPYIAEFYGEPILKQIARISPLGLLISPFAGIQGMLLTSRLDFKTPCILGICNSIVSGAVAIILAYNGYGVWALVINGLLTTVINVVALCCIVRWYPKASFSKSSFKELFSFSSKMLGSQIIGKIYDNIAPLIIGKYYSPAQLGVYNRAKGYADLPSTTFIITLNSVVFPALSKIQDDIPKVGETYRRMIRMSSFVSFPLMIGMAAVASPLIIFLVTDKWAESIPLLQLLCFALLLLPINTLNESLLLCLGRSDIYLKYTTICTSINLIAISVSLPFGLISFCIGQIVATFIRFLLKARKTKQLVGIGIKEQLGDVSSFFINSCIMGGLCLLVQLPFESNGVKLLVAILTGVVYYIVTSWLFHRKEMLELISIVRKRGN